MTSGSQGSPETCSCQRANSSLLPMLPLDLFLSLVWLWVKLRREVVQISSLMAVGKHLVGRGWLYFLTKGSVAQPSLIIPSEEVKKLHAILCSNAQVGMNSVVCSQFSCMTSHQVYLPLVCVGTPSVSEVHGNLSSLPCSSGAAFITLSQGGTGFLHWQQKGENALNNPVAISRCPGGPAGLLQLFLPSHFASPHAAPLPKVVHMWKTCPQL